MTTYYDHGGIRVTSHELVIHRRRYELDHLFQLRIARGSATRAATAFAAAATISAVLATLSVLLGSYSGRAGIRGVEISVGLVAIFFLTVTTALAVRRLRPRPFELWAEYGNHTVLLLWSQNERVFNQITRAILRARQSDSPNG